MIVLVIEPVDGKGRFIGKVDGQVIVTSCQPFPDGARVLLARGYDPATRYNMRHGNSTLSFATTTLESAAAWTVSDPAKKSPHLRKFEPFEAINEDLEAEAAE